MNFETKIRSLFSSRRFWVAAGGVALVVMHEGVGIPEDQAQVIVNLLMAWIVGDSLSKTGA